MHALDLRLRFEHSSTHAALSCRIDAAVVRPQRLEIQTICVPFVTSTLEPDKGPGLS